MLHVEIIDLMNHMQLYIESYYMFLELLQLMTLKIRMNHLLIFMNLLLYLEVGLIRNSFHRNHIYVCCFFGLLKCKLILVSMKVILILLLFLQMHQKKLSVNR